MALLGLAVGLIGLLAGALVLIFAGGDVAGNYVADAPALNGFAIGIPALVLGAVAYFMGRSAISRIKESQGRLGGTPSARAASWIGVAATIVGAVSTLAWLVIALLGSFGPPPA